MSIAKFIHGRDELDLNSSPYTGIANFTPPSVNTVYNIGTGTSANRLGGGKLISTSQSNRTLSFSVRVMGSSQYAVEGAARRLQLFLDDYSDEDPIYFQFLSTGVPIPLWGQLGQPLNYEIVTCDVRLTDHYSDSKLRSAGMMVDVSMQVKPVALGVRQLLASSLGAVIEDDLGNANGIVRGLRILPAGDNNSLNPRFQQSSDWSDGWTAGSNIIEVKNTDLRFIFPGSNASARLTSKGATNNSYTESINVGNTNNHIYWVIAKREDSAAITSDDLQYIYDGTSQTTTFTSLGNGFYACEYSRAGEASSKAMGVVVKSGRTVYLCFHMVEEQAVRTYPGCGDDLGWAWTGTYHASASTRTAGRTSIPVDTSSFDIGHGAIAVTWKTDYANTAAGDRFIFSCGSTSLRAYYQASDDKIYFTDHTNTISTAAQTFAAGDILRLIFVWGQSGLAIYKNGSSAASGATFTPPANPTSVFIGTDDSAANHASGVFMGFTIYPRELTAGEMTAVDATSSAISSTGHRVDFIPWLWTKDGDNAVDNCDDSTYDNWAISGGIPGNLAASTEWYFSKTSNLDTYYLFQNANEYFTAPSNVWFGDISATVDAAACGGSAYVDTHGGGAPSSDVSHTSYYVYNADKMSGTAKCFVRAKHEYADGTYYFKIGYRYGSSNNVYSRQLELPLTTAYRLYQLPDMQIERIYQQSTISPVRYMYILMNLGGTVGGTSGYESIDYIIAWVGKSVKLSDNFDPGIGYSAIYLSGFRAYGVLTTTNSIELSLSVDGDIIDLEPTKYNTLMVHSGGYSENDALNSTVTFSKVNVTPRWKLI